MFKWSHEIRNFRSSRGGRRLHAGERNDGPVHQYWKRASGRSFFHRRRGARRGARPIWRVVGHVRSHQRLAGEHPAPRERGARNCSRELVHHLFRRSGRGGLGSALSHAQSRNDGAKRSDFCHATRFRYREDSRPRGKTYCCRPRRSWLGVLHSPDARGPRAQL